jgi:hypothetical protein
MGRGEGGPPFHREWGSRKPSKAKGVLPPGPGGGSLSVPMKGFDNGEEDGVPWIWQARVACDLREQIHCESEVRRQAGVDWIIGEF